jgi:hypothetical protein
MSSYKTFSEQLDQLYNALKGLEAVSHLRHTSCASKESSAAMKAARKAIKDYEALRKPTAFENGSLNANELAGFIFDQAANKITKPELVTGCLLAAGIVAARANMSRSNVVRAFDDLASSNWERWQEPIPSRNPTHSGSGTVQ